MFVSLKKDLAQALELEYRAKSPTQEECPPEYYWYMVRKTVKGKDYLFLINEASRFLVVMNMPNGKLALAIKSAITNALAKIGVKQHEIKAYFKKAGEFEYGESRDERLNSWLSEQSEDAIKRLKLKKPRSLSELNAVTNILPVIEENPKESFLPRIKMENILNYKKIGEKAIRNTEIFEIESTLMGVEIKTQRTFLIQSDATFEELKDVLLSLYNFSDWHLYNFEIYNKSRRRKPDLTINDPREEDIGGFMSFFLKRKTGEMDLQFRDYLEKAHHTIFVYDFIDDWRINLTLKNVYEGGANENFLPYLLSACGPNPIEDIGGAYGYNALLYALKNPKEVRGNEELEDLLEWGKEEGFDPKYKLELPRKILIQSFD